MYRLLTSLLLAMCGLTICVPPEPMNITQSTSVFNNAIKVDLSPQRFNFAVSPDLVCSVCKDVYADPVALECGHTYCRTCIVLWFTRGSLTCPVDNQRITTTSLIPIYSLKSLIGELDIRCPFDVHGCKVTTKVSQAQDHGQQCPHNPSRMVVCNRRCGLTFRLATFFHHDCFDALLESHSKLAMENNALMQQMRLCASIDNHGNDGLDFESNSHLGLYGSQSMGARWFDFPRTGGGSLDSVRGGVPGFGLASRIQFLTNSTTAWPQGLAGFGSLNRSDSIATTHSPERLEDGLEMFRIIPEERYFYRYASNMSDDTSEENQVPNGAV